MGVWGKKTEWGVISNRWLSVGSLKKEHLCTDTGGEGVSLQINGRAFQTEGTACTKAPGSSKKQAGW